MLEMIFIGVACAIVIAWLLGRELAQPEPETEEFDAARVNSVFAELDSQEMKTKKVRAI